MTNGKVKTNGMIGGVRCGGGVGGSNSSTLMKSGFVL